MGRFAGLFPGNPLLCVGQSDGRNKTARGGEQSDRDARERCLGVRPK